jgi:hypothetical protein
MSPEQRIVNVIELQLCKVCMNHPVDRKCYTKAKADFKGCSEGGCGMEHHPVLHWALIAKLFQVQVVAEYYPPTLPPRQPYIKAETASQDKQGGGQPRLQRQQQPHSGD